MPVHDLTRNTQFDSPTSSPLEYVPCRVVRIVRIPSPGSLPITFFLVSRGNFPFLAEDISHASHASWNANATVNPGSVKDRFVRNIRGACKTPVEISINSPHFAIVSVGVTFSRVVAPGCPRINSTGSSLLINVTRNLCLARVSPRQSAFACTK